jgi:3-methyladenine DNA glycosylase AlkD
VITATELRKRLRAHADPASVAILQSFFKTGPGQYGEGDVFIGVRLPAMRALCRECRDVPLATALTLLGSTVHEERLLALLLMVDRFTRGDEAERKRVYDAYLANTDRINNWDLVDLSAPAVVGGFLWERSRAPLTRLARSTSLWERRIAIVSTHYFIRNGDLADTFRIADLLLDDPHDLIHKATGWMLREAGKRDGSALRQFLATRHDRMPRTMLRYAIERFPESERKKYLVSRGQTPRRANL